MDFLTQNVAIELPSEYDWNCTTKEPKFICAFSGIFVCFKKLICLFNVLKKFATVSRRPSEAAVLSSTNWIKSFRIIVRDQTVIVLRRCRAIKCKATWQRNEIRVSILLGIKVTLRFFLVAAYSFKSSRSVECRVLTSQLTPARVCGEKSLCKNI